MPSPRISPATRSISTASLIFIPFGEGAAGRQLVFNGYTAAGEARAVTVPGQKITYAPASPGGANENTNLTTTALYFTSQPAPYDKTFGVFLPKLFKASVNLPAVEAMLGQTAATKIASARPVLDQRRRQHHRLVRPDRQGSLAGIVTRPKSCFQPSPPIKAAGLPPPTCPSPA